MADNGEPSGITPPYNVQAFGMQKCNSQKKRRQITFVSFYVWDKLSHSHFLNQEEIIDCNIPKKCHLQGPMVWHPPSAADTLQALQKHKRLLNQQRLAARGNTDIVIIKM
jgi:hypothetical protein